MLVLYILYQSRQAEKLSTTKVLQKYRNVTSLMLTKAQQRTLLLLVYNEFFGNKKWINVDDDCSVPRTRKTPCRKDKFEVTYDKGRFYDSDFVLIHAASNLPSMEHLNEIWKQKPFGQLWIYFLMESPITSPDTSRFKGMFDLTFSYRTDSEFWFPYGTYEEIPFIINLSQHDFSIGKDKLVIWPVSNCRPPIRKLLVHELQKYITVDVYGRCSEQFGEARDCPRHTESCRIVTRHYKFLLAFENALCEDYITEKYWEHLGDEDVVPVVMGGANYTKLAIPGSYINVLDFKTVKDLADYLHYLDRNSTAYNEYFKWRQKYRKITLQTFCSFCEVLSSEIDLRGHTELTDFWVTQGKCDLKDQLVLNMWAHSSKFSEYFLFLMSLIFIIAMVMTLMIYLTQVYLL
ncbi:unnamed protein product [Porites lobata]|uniref:Fucosyltransferase n=1 Tax=Porites lobata TaxID=104759 RepID=A0ABN8N3L8_9CNID|nr:unnamed protein product [Porites lobata]